MEKQYEHFDMQAARPDVRLVHVAVRAEGPTRVLCFSDSRGFASPGDEEDTLINATAKLEGLQRHLQAYAIMITAVCIRNAD